MAFEDLRDALRRRLDEADRGDRGWWLVTRVHLSAARLQAIARYLHDAGAANDLILSNHHYRDLARILDIHNANPRQTINRHYFLAMETPLRLLAKVNANSWDSIRLTRHGIRLATEDDSVAVFERLLSRIQFCRGPWYNESRVAEYQEFDVKPYQAALSVMRANSGYIDIDEFDLFVSRIRTDDEIDGASNHVREFRQLTEQQKARLRTEVERRVPAGKGADQRKPYNNWRDMARHTFSLFSLGQSAYRAENELILAGFLAEPEQVRPRTRAGQPGAAATMAPPRVPRSRVRTILRIPDTEAPEDLLSPPTLPQRNSGVESELLVGKILAADGWQVVYYGQRRGYGFDLWAMKDEQAFIIEIKSFADAAGSIVLTPLEHAAAQHHSDNFLLVIVEYAEHSTPILHVIQDPTASIQFTRRNIAQFTAPRSAWRRAATGTLPGA